MCKLVPFLWFPNVDSLLRYYFLLLPYCEGEEKEDYIYVCMHISLTRPRALTACRNFM